MAGSYSEKEVGAKKTYENPKMEIVSFQAADVIVTSMGATSGGNETGWTGYY